MTLLLLLSALFGYAYGQCQDGTQLTFIKTSGYQPRLTYKPPLLYSSTYGASVTAECYNRCRDSPECEGFFVNYATASCFRVSGTTHDRRYGLMPSPGVAYFSKACLPLPLNCSEMAWSMETTPGYELLGPQHTVIPNVYDRFTCMKECLIQNYNGEPCLSANFHAAEQTCTLSSHQRWSNPDLFIPSTQKYTEYFENNCIKESKDKICWQLPAQNISSIRSELQLYNVTRDECRDLCQDEEHFKCRAYSFLNYPPQCLMHSDVSLVNPGPPLYPDLIPTIGGEYVESINCVNISISCNEEFMSVTLSSTKFKGQLSVRGFSNTCSTRGRGSDITTLKIPIEDNKCNVKVAHALGDYNRTMVSTVIVVQYHELIQRSGDRIIKVSCFLSESHNGNNITLGTGYSVQEPGIQNEITGSSTSGSGTPKARMYLIDGLTGGEVSNVKVGDPLILRIKLQEPYNVTSVRAGHLVASSGDKLESLLLLDWNGCPPDPAVFPAFSKTSENTIEASFKSFRFQSTQVLNLAIVLTFCKPECQPTDCGNGIVSYGRKKRAAEDIEPIELTISVNVQDNNITSAPILQASLGSYEGKNDEICVSFLTASLISLFWLLLQCSLLAACCCILQKRKEREIDTISLSRDFQPPKHVTFSTNSMADLRLSTPMT